MDKNRILFGYIMAVVAILFWSFNVIIARYLAGNLTPIETSFGRWFFALLFILPFTFRPIIKDWKIIKKHWKILLLSSIIGLVLMNTLVYKAGETALAVNMSIIGTIGPVFTIIFARIILKTPITIKEVLGLCIAVLGVIVLITKGNINILLNFDFVVGDLWMIGMTVFFGAFSIIQTKKPKELSQATMLSVTIIIAVIVMLPIVLWNLQEYSVPKMTLDVWAILIYMGLLPSLLSFWTWDKAIEIIGAFKTNMLYYLMPLFSTIEAYFILAEKISGIQVLGAVIILLGVFISSTHSTHKFRIFRA